MNIISSRILHLQISGWINDSKLQQAIICLQELKIRKEQGVFQMGIFGSNGTQVMDTNSEGRVRAALIVPEQFMILDQGMERD